MKLNYIFFVLILTSWIGQTQIVIIPDPIFKDALVNNPVVDTNNDGIGDVDVDTNNDGEVQTSEALAVTALYVSDFGINNLQGMESFENLQIFDGSENNIESVSVTTMADLEVLDVSSNFILGAGGLDVTQNGMLRKLYADQNDITIVNVSQNANLEILSLRGNQIFVLDVDQNLNLIALYCANNDLMNLDVSQNQNLEELVCNSNELSSLNVTQNPALKVLSCGSNELTTLNISQNPEIIDLTISSSTIQTINTSSNPNLERFTSLFGDLNQVDFSKNLQLHSLFIYSNDLETLDVSQNQNLVNIVCYGNMLTSLDLSNNFNLQNIYSANNLLTELNIRSGNNGILLSMSAGDNPNLSCIQVDNVNYANSQMCIDPIGSGWCKDETAFYSENCSLGIEEFATVEVSIYPNPTQELLSIDSPLKIDEVKIYSVSGTLILKTFKTEEIDITKFSQGIYLAKISVQNEIISKRFIKE
jgi:hypothetical protein